MKFFKKIIFIAILFSFAVFTGCGKDKIEQQSSEKMNEKKDAIKQEKQVENKEVTNKPADVKNLFKIDKVEKSAGKKSSPNIIWSEGGSQKSLKDLKGNVVLINFWATWCGPCIREMPDLSTISAELKDKNFKIIGVNIFQQPNSKKVEDFLKTNPVAYTILDGNQEVVDAFSEAGGSNIEAIPTTFIIDKEGKLAESIVGGRDKAGFMKLIDKYLN